jgi:hypothetical protein
MQAHYLATHLTGPISVSFVFVSSSNGVLASSQTPLSPDSLIAVDRPPMGNTPKREKGRENVATFGVTFLMTVGDPDIV